MFLFSDGTLPAGYGTEADPYLIADIDNLLYLSTNDYLWAVDTYFLQTADIDANDTENWNDGAGFSPIGDGLNNEDARRFKGTYNGNDYSISNLYLSRPTQSLVGFFGSTENANIMSINLIDTDVTGFNLVGRLVGKNHFSTISNSYSSGSVIGTFCVGGLVGANYFSSTVSNSHSTGSVTGTDCVGGLVGDNHAATISNSYSTGSVTGTDYVGGLVGENSSSSTVSNSYSTGSVIGTDFVGGFVGYNGYFDESSTIYNSYSIGIVTGSGISVGGFLGVNDYSSVFNSFWDTQTSCWSTSAGGTGKTTVEMQSAATYTSLATLGLYFPWDFVNNPFDDIDNEDYWSIDSVINNGYPYLTAIPVVEVEEEGDFKPSANLIQLSNYPNPFNPRTIILFNLNSQSTNNAEIIIYNIKGQKVEQFSNLRDQESVTWNAEDLASGVYFCRLVYCGKDVANTKLLLLK